MSNFDTIDAITDNLQGVLKKLGVNFARETFEDLNAIPASLLPHGQIFYEREDFEYAHGQKPEYANALFRLRVIIAGQDARLLIREQQKWVHLIREALTVNALNIGGLATSKLINMVSTENVEIENMTAKAALNYRVAVRYRET